MTRVEAAKVTEQGYAAAGNLATKTPVPEAVSMMRPTRQAVTTLLVYTHSMPSSLEVAVEASRVDRLEPRYLVGGHHCHIKGASQGCRWVAIKAKSGLYPSEASAISAHVQALQEPLM